MESNKIETEAGFDPMESGLPVAERVVFEQLAWLKVTHDSLFCFAADNRISEKSTEKEAEKRICLCDL